MRCTQHIVLCRMCRIPWTSPARVAQVLLKSGVARRAPFAPSSLLASSWAPRNLLHHVGGAMSGFATLAVVAAACAGGGGGSCSTRCRGVPGHLGFGPREIGGIGSASMSSVHCSWSEGISDARNTLCLLSREMTSRMPSRRTACRKVKQWPSDVQTLLRSGLSPAFVHFLSFVLVLVPQHFAKHFLRSSSDKFARPVSPMLSGPRLAVGVPMCRGTSVKRFGTPQGQLQSR